MGAEYLYQSPKLPFRPPFSILFRGSVGDWINNKTVYIVMMMFVQTTAIICQLYTYFVIDVELHDSTFYGLEG
jgi:hypothetical protein